MANAISKETKKPTGLKVERNGNKFTTSWTQPSGGYEDGQQWKYKLSTMKKFANYPSASSADIGVSKKEKNINITLSDYYPAGDKLTSFAFEVRGNRKNTKTDMWSWSEWNTKEYVIKVPSTPTISAETSSNRTKFSWTVATDPKDNRPFRRVSVWTALIENYNADPKNNTNWTLITTDTTHAEATIDKSPYSSAIGGFQATGYIEFTESTSKLANKSWTRMVKIVAQGCAGDSIAYEKHVYAKAYQANQTESTVSDTPSGYAINVGWDTATDKSRPIDYSVLQWVIATPNSDMSCPSGVSWNDARTVYDTSENAESAVMETDVRCGYDECLYSRVTTYYDDVPTYGAPILQVAGKLSPPTITVGTTSQSSQTAQITISHGFVVSGTKVAIIYSKNGSQSVVGLVSSSSTVTVKCPAWSSDDTVTFGARAVLPKTSTSHTDSDGVTTYDINAYMESDLVMQSGTVAVAPSGVTLARDGDDVRVSWQNNWVDADGIELSWSDNLNAWESTDQPDTFTIDNPYLTNWRIAGLETGKAWHVKVRAYVDGDTKSYSPFSATASINLSSAPSIPTLFLSRGIVPIGEPVTASWEYASTDGTPQDEARIYSYASGNYTLIATSKTQEYADLRFSTAGSYQLCVEVISASGQNSGKSPLTNLAVAIPLSCSMTNSLQDVTGIDDDGDERVVHALTELPLTVTVSGAGTGGTTSVAIIRADSYYLERPDESELDGFLGETIYTYTQTGNSPISIEYDDLIGSLDDGGRYTLTATVTDNIGQSASASDDFTVLWARQAIEPDGEVIIDRESYAAILKPIAPTGTIETDVCDIYRLSADKPALVYRGAVFGQKYVDPYPAIGENGGYRFVFRTKDGDYTTADNTLAFYDCYDDMLESTNTIINFGGETLVLQYNLDVSHQWEKGFVSEKFLDGSVKGYWNAGVSRSGNVSSVSIPMLEEDIISALRRLSEYEGRCHVRTPDGSSFPADIQVSESWNHDKRWTMADFQFNIQRTDGEPAGIEYVNWERL